MFYWGTLAGYHMLRFHRPASAGETSEFLPNQLAARLQVRVDQLDEFIERQNWRLRSLCLVEGITYYEEYLRAIVARTLQSAALPSGKKARVDVLFDHVPEATGAAVCSVK